MNDGEDIDALYANICEAIATDGPIAVICKRPMTVGIEGLEGTTHGHDVIPTDLAIKYLEKHGCQEAADYLKNIEKPKHGYEFLGSSDARWDPTVTSLVRQR